MAIYGKEQAFQEADEILRPLAAGATPERLRSVMSAVARALLKARAAEAADNGNSAARDEYERHLRGIIH